ncbi:MAG: hypothetical protein ACJ8R9_05690 [Steroidobacteraceae bacterium]
MTSTVLEFNTSRTHLHHAVLRAAGIADPLCWRVEGDLGQRYEDHGLLAVIDLAASDRCGVLRLVRFLPGYTPIDIAHEEVLRLTLDGAIVRKALQRAGRNIRQISKRWVFDDGGHIELRADLDEHLELLEIAQRTRKTNFPGSATTAEIVAAWSPHRTDTALPLYWDTASTAG